MKNKCARKTKRGYVGKKGEAYLVETTFAPGNSIIEKKFSNGNTKLIKQFKSKDEALKFAKDYVNKELC